MKKEQKKETKKKLSIIIPCYNEEAGIPNLASELLPILKELEKEYSTEVIFVDDGSKDKTYELIKKHFDKIEDCSIIQHKINMNLGASIRTGFLFASGDIIMTMDSDCTYPPKEIPNLLKLLDKNTDIVTASPYHPKGDVEGVPKYRLFLSRSISLIYSVLLRKRIYTWTALFRVYKKEVIKKVPVKYNDFLGVTQILISAIDRGYKVKEFPTTLFVRRYGQSKIRLAQIIKSHIKFIVLIIWKKLNARKI